MRTTVIDNTTHVDATRTDKHIVNEQQTQLRRAKSETSTNHFGFTKHMHATIQHVQIRDMLFIKLLCHNRSSSSYVCDCLLAAIDFWLHLGGC